MADEHARLSPSDAERWMACAGSILLTEDRPRLPSVYSAEGTAAHWVRATCLELGLDVRDFLGHTLKFDGFTFTVEPEWVDYLQPGIDRLREIPGGLFLEHRVLLDRWMPGQFGTLDAGICGPDIIVINDLKFGAGEQVDVDNNKQLKIYALGYWDNIARHHTKATRFRLEIDQPRAGGISTWETTLDDLLAFGEEVKIAAARTYDKDAPLVAGPKQCRWCSIKTTCGAHAEFVLSLFGTKFEDLDVAAMIGEPPSIAKAVTPERRSYILQHGDMFSKWLESMRGEALNDALAGRPVPGLKAVEGRKGDRAWRNPDEAATLLVDILGEDVAYERKLLTPTAAEKKTKTAEWKKVEGCITRAPGKPILVPADDSREAIKPISSLFDDVEVADII